VKEREEREAAIAEVAAARKELSDQLEAISKGKDSAEAAAEAKRLQLAEMEKHKTLLQSNLEKERALMAQAQQDAEAKKHLVEQLASEQKALESGLAEETNKREAAQRAATQAAEQVAKVEKEKLAVQEAMRTEKLARASAEAESAQSAQQLAKLKEQQTQLVADLGVEQKRRTEAEEAVNQMHQEIEAYTIELQRLEEQVQEQSTAAKVARDEADKAAAETQEMEKFNDKLLDELCLIEEAKETAERQSQAASAKAAELEAANRAAQHQLEEEQKKLEEERQLLRAERNKRRSLLDEASNRETAVALQMDEHRAVMSAKEDEVSRLLAMLEEERKTCQEELRAKRTALEKEYETALRNLEEQRGPTSPSMDLQGRVLTLEQQLTTAASREKAMQEQIVHLRDLVQIYQMQLQELQGPSPRTMGAAMGGQPPGLQKSSSSTTLPPLGRPGRPGSGNR